MQQVTSSNTAATRLPHGPKGRKLAVGALVLGALFLSACQQREDERVRFDGILFRAKAETVDKKVTLADFTATVSDVSQSIHAALEAGRYEGTKYCIAQYGTSRIDWRVGPDTPPENLRIVDDTLILSGRCAP